MYIYIPCLMSLLRFNPQVFPFESSSLPGIEALPPDLAGQLLQL